MADKFMALKNELEAILNAYSNHLLCGRDIKLKSNLEIILLGRQFAINFTHFPHARRIKASRRSAFSADTFHSIQIHVSVISLSVTNKNHFKVCSCAKNITYECTFQRT